MPRHRLPAALAAASFLLASALVAPAASAVTADCSVVDLAPSRVAMGVNNSARVLFDVGTDCEEEAEVKWYLTIAWPNANRMGTGPMVANFQPPPNTRHSYIPDGKYTWARGTSDDDQRTGPMNVAIEAFIGESQEEGENLPPATETITVLHRTTWGASFNASPEPRRKGQTIKIVGKLRYADWTTNSYKGFGAWTLLQFRPAGQEDYTNVKWVWNNGVEARTTVKADKTGSWRLRFPGDAANAPSNSKGDTVVVTR
jgi:hypothetical protein